MIGRIATFANSSSLMASGLSLQAKLAEAQAQQASSLKASTYGGLSGDAGKVLSLTGRTARLEAESTAATAAVSIMEQSYSVLGEITDLATTIRAELSSRMSATADLTDLASLADDWLTTLGELLNSKAGDSYLFSGQAADRAAVDLTTLDFTDETSTDYFKGASAPMSFTTATGRSIALSVSADGDGFQSMIRALSLLTTASTSTEVSTAYDLLSDGLTAVAADQEALSARTSALSDYQARMDTQAGVLEAMTTELAGADLAEATVKVTNYQTQLETLYSTLSALSKVKLIDYL
ncbi:flagellin [Caulobacter sp. NIBR1757]|uniref:flagellin n=1 Tax=Caulobacter sp. NIBR1757 TaxID=3016000 RepID=UPI0022F140E2|nr:flagellin [Caulobacter sp. NIBR1757]WGM40649.1 hypothetical protein AMEJIAPC_03596 [Caulobacter sp. NIBR1757]